MTLSLRATNDYIPALDGLRAIAILIVLFSHIFSFPLFPGGFGVTVFFFISGFLITRLIFSEIHLKQEFSIKRFYFRRFLRLYPPLVFIVFVNSIYVFLQGEIPSGQEFSAIFLYYWNYYGLLGGKSILAMGALWSLAVEEHFYIVYPWLIKLLKNSFKAIFCLAVVLVFMILLWRIFLLSHFHFVGGHYTYSSTDTRIDSILYGCLLSLFLEFDIAKKIITKVSSRYVFILAVILLLLCFLIRGDFFRETIRYSIQGIALWIIFASLLFTEKYNFLKLILEHKVLVYIGKISYSLYLWNMFIVFVIVPTWVDVNNQMLFAFTSALLSVLVASFSYYCLEKPFAKLRHKLRA